jgi:Leucine-rich repeat (LRR) protein
MKNILLLFAFIFLLQTVNAQYVAIPDSNFRNQLQQNYPSCMMNGQLDTNCSAILNQTNLRIYNTGDSIFSIEGVQYFKNITSLDCSGNSINYIPSLPSNLVSFYCSTNRLTSLPELPNSLRLFTCGYNRLTSLPILPNSLRELFCSGNELLSLPTLPNTLITLFCDNNNLRSLPELPNSLNYLHCNSNQLTTLLKLPSFLRGLDCSSNQIKYLPPLPETLQGLSCSRNQLVTLPTLPDSVYSLYCDYNYITSLPSLPYNFRELKCSNNQINTLPGFSEYMSSLDCSFNPISCLPLLPYYMDLVITNTNISCLPSYPVGSIDTFLPLCTSPLNICAVNPMIHGKIYNDVNNNSKWDSTEQLIVQQIVKVLPNGWLGSSDEFGNYFVKLDTAISNTWSTINNYRYATITPLSYIKNPQDTLGLLAGSYDFGIHIIPNIKDLETVLGSGPARPGFTTSITVTVNNIGTVSQSDITMKFKKPNGFNFISASVGPADVIDDTLIWNNININYLESQSINIELQVPVNAALGDSALYEAWSNGTQGDTTPLDNYTKWIEVIRGSFDPNDKLVNKETLSPTYNAEKDRLLYTIRFQNTGTDTAFTVIVRDEIPTNLEVSSLRVVNASHPYQLIVREKNIVEVAFPNIQLPDSNINEAKSHGFVQLEFKPKAGLPINAEINNNASIFFDYNSPVITNTATTRVQITTGIADNKKLAFKLFPNPSSEKITVELPYAGNGKWLLIDISGKIIKQSNIENNTKSFDINVNDIESGTYLLSIESNDNLSSSKIVIFR